MAHLDYTKEFESGRLTALFGALGRLATDWLKARAAHHSEVNQQWQNRQAFKNLLGKEDWVYRDMGISKADVEWAAKLPLQINAAQELQKVREASSRRLK